MAFPDGWSHKWPIAINADSVISSPVADWPCLITDAHIPAGAWALMQATGADLRFSLDEAGATELYYDAPRLSVAGESAHLYVAVPSLASTADTTIYGWCGNAEATAPSAAWMQNTYPSDWEAFWPMEEGTGTAVGDRTANGNDGTIVGNCTWSAQGDGSWALVFANNASGVNLTGLAQAAPWTLLCRAQATVSKITNYLFDSETGRVIVCLAQNLNNDAMTLYDGEWRHGQTQGLVGTFHTLGAHVGETTCQFWVDGTDDGEVGSRGLSIGGATYIGRRYAAATETYYWSGPVSYMALLQRNITADEAAIHHLMLNSPATFAAAGELVAVGGASRAYFGTRNLGAQLLRRTGL